MTGGVGVCWSASWMERVEVMVVDMMRAKDESYRVNNNEFKMSSLCSVHT